MQVWNRVVYSAAGSGSNRRFAWWWTWHGVPDLQKLIKWPKLLHADANSKLIKWIELRLRAKNAPEGQDQPIALLRCEERWWRCRVRECRNSEFTWSISVSTVFLTFFAIMLLLSIFQYKTLIKVLTRGALPDCSIRLSIERILQQKQWFKVEKSKITQQLHITLLLSQVGFLHSWFLHFLYDICISILYPVQAV